MSEVEKLYELAGVKPDCIYLFLVDGNGENEAARTISIGSKADLKRLIVDCGVKGKVIKSTNTLKPFYPPFTAEKQLELIKWLGISRPIHITFLCKEWNIESMIRYGKRYNTFENALCGYTATIWQDLTESEQEEIRKILKG